MKSDNKKEISKINKLYKTALQKDCKLAFEIFENLGWTLSDIINFIIENYRIEKIDDRIKAISERSFNIASLYFDFRVVEDWEALDDTTDYYLELTLNLKDSNDKVIKSAIIKNIQSESTFDPFWGMGKDDILSFTEKMDEYTNKVLSDIDNSKKNKLYKYIHDYYSIFIDKLNNKVLLKQ